MNCKALNNVAIFIKFVPMEWVGIAKSGSRGKILYVTLGNDEIFCPGTKVSATSSLTLFIFVHQWVIFVDQV